MSGKSLNWVKHAQGSKAARERSEMSSRVAMHAKSIAAKKVVHQSLNHIKPFFQWTDFELGQLGYTIKREWVRRRKPVIYKDGHRVGVSVAQKIRPRLEEYTEKTKTYTREYINHLDTINLNEPKRIETKRY